MGGKSDSSSSSILFDPDKSASAWNMSRPKQIEARNERLKGPATYSPPAWHAARNGCQGKRQRKSLLNLLRSSKNRLRARERGPVWRGIAPAHRLTGHRGVKCSQVSPNSGHKRPANNLGSYSPAGGPSSQATLCGTFVSLTKDTLLKATAMRLCYMGRMLARSRRRPQRRCRRLDGPERQPSGHPLEISRWPRSAWLRFPHRSALCKDHHYR